MMTIGELFPAGGRVEPEQMIGREGDLAEVVLRLHEGLHVLLTGDRRIGKTTVCNAACARLREEHGYLVVDLEAPKQSTATGVCQLLIDRCLRVDSDRHARAAAKVLKPMLELWLKDKGLPLDLSGLGTDLPPGTRRAALELPLTLAEKFDVPLVLFIDELQRAVDYADGEGLVGDLIDIYAGQNRVVVLVDGSQSRVVERLLNDPFAVGKLADRLPLPPTIPEDQWHAPLRRRFAAADLSISSQHVATLVAFGAGKPYHTMTGARHVALTARKLDLDEVDDQCMTVGLQEAGEHLDDDE